MSLNTIIDEYKKISATLNQKWPIEQADQRVFARTMKIVEELGELADEILSSMNLQRDSKIAKFSHTNIDEEFADVFGSLILLAIELDIDIETAIKNKIEFTKQRLHTDDSSV